MADTPKPRRTRKILLDAAPVVDAAGAASVLVGRFLDLRGAVVDSFYVNQIEDGKIVDPERQNTIRNSLLSVMLSLH